MSFEFRQELTKTRRFSEKNGQKCHKNGLNALWYPEHGWSQNVHIPKTALNGHFRDKKNVMSILQFGPIAISVFVSFLSGSPFFVLKIFTRPSVVLCLSLTTLLACPSGWTICTLIIEHLGIVSGEQTRSLRSLSRISQAKMDGHSALYLEFMSTQVTFYPPLYILLMSKLPNLILTNLSTRCTTEFVATLGFDPPIAFGRIDPVS